MTERMKFIFPTTLLLFLTIAPWISAQETTGSLIGAVRDTTGATIPGARISIYDAEKNVLVRTVETDAEGQFSAPLLPAGIYNIEAEAQGFKKQISQGVKLDLNQRRSVDLVLEVGNLSETVTVEATANQVEISTPLSSSLISGDQARELALNNRNWVQLVALAPGVSNDLSDQVYVGSTNPDGQANTINIAVNGARSSQNTFTVDGADITDRGSNITIQAYPSVDSIGEFKVLRSLYPAESGRSGGGQINIVTRSGSSRFHGSAFEFFRNEMLNANSFLINSSANPAFGRTSEGKAKRPPFHYNNFGWTLGGPVPFVQKLLGEKGKNTFFFFSQEFRKDRRFSSASTVSVPNSLLRSGVFPMPVCINRPALGEASCTDPYILPANTPLPASLINPTSKAYLTGIYSKLPLPNNVSVTNPFGLTTAIANRTDFRQEVIKIDHSFSPRLSAYYRYQHDSIPTLDGNSLFSSGSGLPGVSTTETNSPGKAHTAQATFIASPKMIFEGRYNYGYGAILSRNVGLLALANTRIPVTLPFENTRDRIPTLTGNGFTGLSGYGPYDNFSYKHNFTGSWTAVFGRHTVKSGGVFSVYRKNENNLAGSNEGSFSAFGTSYPTGQTFPQNLALPDGTVLPNALTTTVAANLQRWANFMVGNVTTFSQAHYDYTGDLRQKTLEAYVQDEYRVRRNVILYLGLRYSYFPAPYDQNGRLSNFIPSLYNQANAPQVTGAGNRIAGSGNFCNGMIVNSQNYSTGPSVYNCNPTRSPWGKNVIDSGSGDIAPRFGLSWDPFGKGRTAIRTGYGIYHEQVLNGTFLQIIGQNPPYQETMTGSNTRMDAPAGSISFSASAPAIRAIQSDWKTPYMQHWSLDIQHQLSRSTYMTIGYYGSKATHLIGITEMNDLPAGKALQSQCAPGNNYYGQSPAPALVNCQPAGYAFRGSAAVTGNPNVVGTTSYTDAYILDQLRPYRGFRGIYMIQPRYDSNYHSLQASVQQRFGRYSQVNAAYTWSRNMTNSPNDRSGYPQDSYDLRSEYQRATLDRRHILTANYVYELPFLRQQKGVAGKVLGGWQVSGIVSFNTGLPFTAVTSSLDYAGLGLVTAGPTARPNLLCDPNQNAPHTVQQWFNTSCFQVNPPTTGAGSTGLPNTPGSAGRGVINGPPTTRFDFTLSKFVRLWENVRLQLRGEVFNLLNHTNFRGFTSLNVTSTAFGQIGSTRDPRTMQVAAKILF